MADDQNKAISRRVWEVFASGDLNELDDLVAPGAAFHDTQDPFGDQRGPEHMRNLMGMYRKSFSNMRFDIKNQIAEGDYVCTMIEAQGDNTGEIMGQPATGKHSRINLTDVDRIEDGKIAESWVTWDTLGMLQQLGLIPAGAQQTTTPA
ncbi:MULTISPECIES: ester cyclase [Mycolicibacterium]|uniref:ester cyclase n=1 Tax=Mycolicibacterium TaxID=1866885 RepID=UPI00082C42C9|nr:MULTISPECIES: ester cyclase [Mycolicibacterium]MCV7065403.1 ester cyclase [Mycolicibacterium farcinogenes]WKG02413.1 ester cyclase [Mycolicibacterium sp. HK-90]